LSDNHFSGINRSGEYLMALIMNYEHRENFYAWEYLDKFLEPVYEVKAGNVPILKIWKNDLEHTKLEYRLEEKELVEKATLLVDKGKIEVELKDDVLLSRMQLFYSLSDNCTPPLVSLAETSVDGLEWVKERDPLVFAQVGKRSDSFKPAWEDYAIETTYKNEDIEFYFAARRAAFIRIESGALDSCLLNDPGVKLYVLNK